MHPRTNAVPHLLPLSGHFVPPLLTTTVLGERSAPRLRASSAGKRDAEIVECGMAIVDVMACKPFALPQRNAK